MARLMAVFVLVLVIVLVACDPFECDRGGDPADACNERCVISGYVFDEEGNPLKGVKIIRSRAGVGYVMTDRRGHYTVPSNVMWWNYCLTPSKPPWAFEPSRRCYHKIERNYTDQNFVAARIESFDISGYVIDERSLPLPNVVITVEGSEDASARTNLQGYYIVRNNKSRQDYCLIPYKAGYTFEPAERCYENLDESYYSQNFLAAEGELIIEGYLLHRNRNLLGDVMTVGVVSRR